MNDDAKMLCAGDPAGGLPTFAYGTKNVTVLPLRLADVAGAVPVPGVAPVELSRTFVVNGRPFTFWVTRNDALPVGPRSVASRTSIRWLRPPAASCTDRP